MKSLLILTLFTLFFSGSCKKEEPPKKLELPPQTQEGKNILACKINGKIFIAEGKQSDLGPSYGILYGVRNSDGMTRISAKAETPFDADIFLYFIHTKDKTFYILNNEEHNSASLYMPVSDKILAETYFRTNKENTGNVNLTFYENDIIAGTFEFNAISDDGEIVHITEGRFDFFTK